ncbi:MAG: hypothetical protein ACRECD_14615 [Burkholderiaceae bacterium]
MKTNLPKSGWPRTGWPRTVWIDALAWLLAAIAALLLALAGPAEF